MSELPPLCPNCNEPLAGGANYCANCGWRPEPPKTSEKLTYGLLLLFAGVPLLAFGGCFSLEALGSDWTVKLDAWGIASALVALICIGSFVALLIQFVRSFRRGQNQSDGSD